MIENMVHACRRLLRDSPSKLMSLSDLIRLKILRQIGTFDKSDHHISHTSVRGSGCAC